MEKDVLLSIGQAENLDILSEMEMINIYGGDEGGPDNGMCNGNGSCTYNGICMSNGTCNYNPSCSSNGGCAANSRCDINGDCAAFGVCSYGQNNDGCGGGGGEHETIKPNENEVHRVC